MSYLRLGAFYPGATLGREDTLVIRRRDRDDSPRLLGSFATWPALVGARYPAFEPVEELGLEA